MTRINNLSMRFLDVVQIMSEGNPGAATVLMTLNDRTSDIDPDAALGGLGAILNLDTHGIYGERIWMFYKNACKGNIIHVLGLMRAVQLGLLSENKLNRAIDNNGEGLDIPQIVEQVMQELPNFNTGK